MEYERFEHDLYVNQICVQIEKPKLPKEIWASYNIEHMFQAMKTLTKGGFELYMYMISNIDKYKFGLGPTPVGNATGMSAKTYHRAVVDLKEKGYLIYKEEFVKGANEVTAPKWHFYSAPPMVKNV